MRKEKNWYNSRNWKTWYGLYEGIYTYIKIYANDSTIHKGENKIIIPFEIKRKM